MKKFSKPGDYDSSLPVSNWTKKVLCKQIRN
jgi:hypothetical protein